MPAAGEAAAIVVVGRTADPRVRALSRVADRSGRTCEIADPASPDGSAMLAAAGQDGSVLPIVRLGEVVLVDPTDLDLIEELGFPRAHAHTECEVAVVGAGLAGLAAAVGTATAGRRTVAVDPTLPGGSVDRSATVCDYLGFPGGISAGALVDRAVEQARAAGVVFLLTERVEEILDQGYARLLVLTSGATVRSRAVVVASGAARRPAVELALPGLFEAVRDRRARPDPGAALAVGAGAAAARQALDYLTMLG